MECNFTVGQKVVCVAKSPQPKDIQNLMNLWGQRGPSIGDILTIRSIYFGVVMGKKTPCLLFEEIKNPPLPYAEGDREGGFAHYRFQPVTERKTDISIFKAMLNPSKEQVPA
ncbi:hypothetical protein [Agrobacterium sp. ST15.13.015]|uniref:hypothetical protein n=1 Tax=Agrobacterium sp. ST15.13.015 TaxID=3017319 RepID=UPI0022BD314F|nr:hypothetical protein [Agrobacterium sp. ST15.13.015]MCZ7502008.1 hypothetical protein [Rhizobium rhizogenes]